MLDQNDVKMIRQAIEETVGELLDRKIDPIQNKVDCLSQKVEANHQAQSASLKRVERMLNDDLMTFMKDTEKIDKRVSVCEVTIKQFQSVIT